MLPFLIYTKGMDCSLLCFLNIAATDGRPPKGVAWLSPSTQPERKGRFEIKTGRLFGRRQVSARPQKGRGAKGTQRASRGASFSLFLSF